MRVCAWLSLISPGMYAAEAGAAPPFTARILATIQYAHTDIYYRTPPGQGLPFVTTREIVPGQRLDVVVMAHGAAVDAQGRADVVFDFAVRGPDGAVSNERKDLRLAVDRPSRPEVILFPAEIVTFVVKEGEPVGDYRFDVTVRDRVADRSIDVSEAVSVISESTSLPWPENTNVITWQASYYAKPQPRLFLPALIELSRLKVVRDRPPQTHGPLLGFGEQVLKDNPWLVPHLEAHLGATKDEWEKRIVSLVLAYAHRDRPETLAKDLRDLLEGLPVESDEPLSGTQLDVLWGRFLASGDFGPLLQLVHIVERYLPFRSAYEVYETRGQRGPPSLEERKGLIGATALWSLGSNARQHKRITNYLASLRDAPGTSEAVKAIVVQVLADPAPPRPGRSRP